LGMRRNAGRVELVSVGDHEIQTALAIPLALDQEDILDYPWPQLSLNHLLQFRGIIGVMIAGDFVKPRFSQSLHQVIILVVVGQDACELIVPCSLSYPDPLIPVELTDIVKGEFLYELSASLGFLRRVLEEYRLYHTAGFNQCKTFLGLVAQSLPMLGGVELV